MDTWELFADSRFELQFKYPAVTPHGEPVDRIEKQTEEMLRVHLISPKRREVYFELTKYPSLSVKQEYERHKESLQKRFSNLSITLLKGTGWKSLPADEYSSDWIQGARAVLLIERHDATYRSLYDPRSTLNLQVLSTLEWMDH